MSGDPGSGAGMRDWVVDVPGPKPEGGGNPPWRRYRRVPASAPEADVLELLKETCLLHSCARATREGVEISVYGSRVTVVRYL